MADDTTTTQDAAGAKTGETEFTPITSQEDFERALSKRLERERSRFADYDEAKAKATEYDKLQEQSKTEAQRLAEKAEAAERRAVEAESKALRAEIAADKGVPASSLHGTTREEMEQAADALLSWRQQAAASNTLNPRGGFYSGASAGDAPPNDPKAKAAAALRSLGRSGS